MPDRRLPTPLRKPGSALLLSTPLQTPAIAISAIAAADRLLLWLAFAKRYLSKEAAMPYDDQGSEWDRIHRRGPSNFSVRAVDRVEALKHLDPAGALSDLDLDDNEGIAMRAAIDMAGQLRDPPLTGNAAIRAALKEYLIGLGYWPAERPGRERR